MRRSAAPLLLILAACLTPAVTRAQNADPGRAVFESRCASCHGADANGGEMGPSIVTRLTSLDDGQIGELVRRGLPARGMPGQPLSDADLATLVRFLRSVQRAPTGFRGEVTSLGLYCRRCQRSCVHAAFQPA